MQVNEINYEELENETNNIWEKSVNSDKEFTFKTFRS